MGERSKSQGFSQVPRGSDAQNIWSQNDVNVRIVEAKDHDGVVSKPLGQANRQKCSVNYHPFHPCRRRIDDPMLSAPSDSNFWMPEIQDNSIGQRSSTDIVLNLGSAYDVCGVMLQRPESGHLAITKLKVEIVPFTATDDSIFSHMETLDVADWQISFYTGAADPPDFSNDGCREYCYTPPESYVVNDADEFERKRIAFDDSDSVKYLRNGAMHFAVKYETAMMDQDQRTVNHGELRELRFRNGRTAMTTRIKLTAEDWYHHPAARVGILVNIPQLGADAVL